MSDISQIKSMLLDSQRPFKTITAFSNLPGIYGIFYGGENIDLCGVPFLKDHLLYIGKTESSQKQRDANTHFKSEKTGSSTLRKSIGALLRESMMLVPIPRSISDIKNGRRSHFKFKPDSEIVLTEWMVNSLNISFYEHHGGVDELEPIETLLIDQLIPPLNLAKNPSNPFRTTIMRLRKICAEIAFDGIDNASMIEEENTGREHIQVPILRPNEKGDLNMIIDNITQADCNSKKIRITVVNKPSFPREIVGEPNTHTLYFSFQDDTYPTTYTIGSKDKKSRSGILRLGNELYVNKLGIQPGTRLEIRRGPDNRYSVRKA